MLKLKDKNIIHLIFNPNKCFKAPVDYHERHPAKQSKALILLRFLKLWHPIFWLKLYFFVKSCYLKFEWYFLNSSYQHLLYQIILNYLWRGFILMKNMDSPYSCYTHIFCTSPLQLLRILTYPCFSSELYLVWFLHFRKMDCNYSCCPDIFVLLHYKNF